MRLSFLFFLTILFLHHIKIDMIEDTNWTINKIGDAYYNVSRIRPNINECEQLFSCFP